MNGIGHAESNALAAAVRGVTGVRGGQTETRGTVTRVDGSGAIWACFVGSGSDTPCVRAVASAKPGDVVTISVRGGRATVTGNASSPATDDSTARTAVGTSERALQAANVAGAAAQLAVIDAGRASVAAKSAENSAKSASASAESAASDASIAMSSALSALTQLGTVEDVMGTLAWLRDHEVYMPATEFVAGETYFELVDGKYVEVENPVAGDVANYYVYDHQATMANFLQTHLTLTSKGLYITQTKPTEYKQGDDDFYCYVVATSFDPDETYYTRSFGTADNPVMNYVEVSNPTADGIGSYYVRKSNAGNIRPTGSGYMLLSGNDILIYGETGLPLARYGGDGIEFYDGKTNTVVASIKDQTLTINKAQLEGELAIEHWVWLQRGSGNISFKWRD